MLKIAICDDNKSDAAKIETALSQIRPAPLDYDVFYHAGELLRYLSVQEEGYHLYIFDIEMPGMSGLKLAEEVRKRDAKALFVFLTGHPEYVMEVFDLVTFGYLSKPVQKEKLEAVILRALQYLDLVRRDFVFQFHRNHFRVCCDDILYISKKGRRASVHTASETYGANLTLEQIWERLDSAVFAQIHISYIVNLAHVRAIDGEDVVLDNGERFLVTRAHKRELKEKHLAFLKRVV